MLDGLAIVDDARNGRPVEPWTSESFEVKIDSSGITFANFYNDQERGRYTLDELRDVLEEYWRVPGVCWRVEGPHPYGALLAQTLGRQTRVVLSPLTVASTPDPGE